MVFRLRHRPENCQRKCGKKSTRVEQVGLDRVCLDPFVLVVVVVVVVVVAAVVVVVVVVVFFRDFRPKCWILDMPSWLYIQFFTRNPNLRSKTTKFYSQ